MGMEIPQSSESAVVIIICTPKCCSANYYYVYLHASILPHVQITPREGGVLFLFRIMHIRVIVPFVLQASLFIRRDR